MADILDFTLRRLLNAKINLFNAFVVIDLV